MSLRSSVQVQLTNGMWCSGSLHLAPPPAELFVGVMNPSQCRYCLCDIMDIPRHAVCHGSLPGADEKSSIHRALDIFMSLDIKHKSCLAYNYKCLYHDPLVVKHCVKWAFIERNGLFLRLPPFVFGVIWNDCWPLRASGLIALRPEKHALLCKVWGLARTEYEPGNFKRVQQDSRLSLNSVINVSRSSYSQNSSAGSLRLIMWCCK